MIQLRFDFVYKLRRWVLFLIDMYLLTLAKGVQNDHLAIRCNPVNILSSISLSFRLNQVYSNLLKTLFNVLLEYFMIFNGRSVDNEFQMTAQVKAQSISVHGECLRNIQQGRS